MVAAVLSTVYLVAAPTPAHAGYSRTLINAQGFDTCFQMNSTDYNAFWSGTPLYEVGLYLGGAAGAEAGVGCVPPTYVSISQILAIGWSATLFWYGPQSQCAVGGHVWLHTISNDPATAYNQGVAEASAARTAASAAGIASLVSINYDLEAFSNNATCRAAAKALVNGWDYEMAYYTPYWGALYGSECASYLTDFVTIANIPHQISPSDLTTAAHGTPASVYGLPCLPDGYWAFDQRIRQYDPGQLWQKGGSHSIYVDNECTDALVANAYSSATVTANNCQYRSHI